MTTVNLDKSDLTSLMNSSIQGADTLYGFALSGPLAPEQCKGLTPAEIDALNIGINTDKLIISASNKPLLIGLLKECKDSSASSAPAGAAAAPAVASGTRTLPPGGKWRPSDSVVSFDDSNFEDIKDNPKPSAADIYGAAQIVEKNMGRWLYSSKEQWDDRLLQFGVTQTEYEHIFTAMADYMVPNTSGTASFHGRSSNMDTVKKLLIEYEENPDKRAAEVYTKLQRMAKSMNNEADSTLLVSLGGVLTVIPVSTPLTLLGAWAVSHFWLKDAGIKGVSFAAQKYDDLAMGILKKIPGFSPTQFDFDALPKDVKEVVTSQMRSTINAIRVKGGQVAFTDVEFTTVGSDAEKAMLDMRTKMEKKMPFQADTMMDDHKALTDNKDGKTKDATLKKVGKAVGGTASGRFGGKALQDGRVFMSELAKGIPSPGKINRPGLEDAKLTTDEHKALIDIENKAKEIEVTQNEIKKIEGDRDTKLQNEITRLETERTRLETEYNALLSQRTGLLNASQSNLQAQITQANTDINQAKSNRLQTLAGEISRLTPELQLLNTQLGTLQSQRDQLLETMKQEKVRELISLIQVEITTEKGKPSPDTTKINELISATKASDPYSHSIVKSLGTTTTSVKSVLDTIGYIEGSRVGITHGTIATDTRLSSFDTRISGLSDSSTGLITKKINEINLVEVSQRNPKTPHISTFVLDNEITAKTELLNGVPAKGGTPAVPGLLAQKFDIEQAIAGGVSVPHHSVTGIDAQLIGIKFTPVVPGATVVPGTHDIIKTQIKDLTTAKNNKTPHSFTTIEDGKITLEKAKLSAHFNDPTTGITSLLAKLQSVALSDIKIIIPSAYNKGINKINGEIVEKIGQFMEGIVKGIARVRAK